MDDAQYIQVARRDHHIEGELEIDENAIVSQGNDDGAYVEAWKWEGDTYVQTWVWVTDEGMTPI